MLKSDVRIDAVYTVDDPKFPGEWRAIKINQVNIKLVNTITGAGLRAHPQYLTPAAETATPAAKLDAMRTRLLHEAQFTLGSVVHVKGKPGYWVVIKKGTDKINVAKLGGDAGRYWRCNPMNLSLADPEGILQNV